MLYSKRMIVLAYQDLLGQLWARLRAEGFADDLTTLFDQGLERPFPKAMMEIYNERRFIRRRTLFSPEPEALETIVSEEGGLS